MHKEFYQAAAEEPLLKRKEALIEMKVDEINTEIVNLGIVTDFELTAEDVQESITFDNTDLSNEDLYEIAQPRTKADENEKFYFNQQQSVPLEKSLFCNAHGKY